MKNKKVKLEIGKPYEPMLVAEIDSEAIFDEVLRIHGGKTYAEVKSDGNRIQVHKGDDRTWLYSRNQNEFNPEVFPELKRALNALPKGIYDGEIVGEQDGIDGFKAIQSRKLKALDMTKVSKYPLKINFFDVLRLDDKTLIDLPLTERRAILENNISNLSKQWAVYSSQDLEEKYNGVIDANLEGLVCKNFDSHYGLGKRTTDWIKIKKFMTLDLTILGVYKGEGKAASLPFAALLLGTRNNGHYETVVKVGLSNREMIDEIHSRIKEGYVSETPKNVVLSEQIEKKVYQRKKPLYFVKPDKSAVVEIKAMNVTFGNNWHSCGLSENSAYSLRIPSVQRYRDDKTPLDCNTTSDIASRYRG